MSAPAEDAVTFSDLSRNPKAVAERATRLGRLRVTHRNASDFYLTAADREEQREENLSTATRIFSALMRNENGTPILLLAVQDVFPWVRHLTEGEALDFTSELFGALSDASELDADANAHEVIVGWRATARIKADRSQYAQALRQTIRDLGPVDVQA